MSATTPHYGWPYQTLTDPPDGAGLGEDLALAIEATVQGLDTQLNTQIDIQTFTANGTWTKPTDAKSVWVRMVGGGGAGGGAPTNAIGSCAMGAGGGAGEYGEGWFDASTLAATVAVTIGAAGTGVSGTTGNNGGTTSFGAGFTAVGGTGGTTRATSPNSFGIGGTAGGTGGVGGTYHAAGAPGGTGWGSASLGISGEGGSSPFGGGGASIRTASQPATLTGNAGTGLGSGGGGGITAGAGAAVAGGAGAGGYCIVITYF